MIGQTISHYRIVETLGGAQALFVRSPSVSKPKVRWKTTFGLMVVSPVSGPSFSSFKCPCGPQPSGCTFPPGKVRPEPLSYFPILPFTLPIPVQRSQPDLAENPAVGPQKPLLMSLKSVVIARLL